MRDPERKSKYQTGPERGTRSPYDAGDETDLIADAEDRGNFCTGPARGPRDRDRKRRPGEPKKIRRSDETQYPGRDKGIKIL